MLRRISNGGLLKFNCGRQIRKKYFNAKALRRKDSVKEILKMYIEVNVFYPVVQGGL
jgi:hypothetical protein